MAKTNWMKRTTLLKKLVELSSILFEFFVGLVKILVLIVLFDLLVGKIADLFWTFDVCGFLNSFLKIKLPISRLFENWHVRNWSFPSCLVGHCRCGFVCWLIVTSPCELTMELCWYWNRCFDFLTFEFIQVLADPQQPVACCGWETASGGDYAKVIFSSRFIPDTSVHDCSAKNFLKFKQEATKCVLDTTSVNVWLVWGHKVYSKIDPFITNLFRLTLTLFFQQYVGHYFGH